MPSFSEIIGVIVSLIVLTIASGRSEILWKSFSELRRVSVTNAQQGWSCPSIFTGKSACTSYDSKRYR